MQFHNRSFNNVSELSRDTLAKFAPSVFAEAPADHTSDKYLFVPTISVVEQIEKEGWAVVNASQSRSRTEEGKDTVRHMLRFRRRDALDRRLFNVGDSVTELVLVNAHNGLAAFNLSLGLFRQVCGNGLIVSDTLAGESVRHVGYDHSKIIEAQYRVLDQETKMIESVEAMRSVVLDEGERTALAKSALALRYDEDQTKPEAFRMLTPRRYADQNKDLWTTFNVIQENMIRGGIRTRSIGANGRIRRNSTRAVNSVVENKRLNQGLWTLAEEMRRLKVNAA